MERIVDIKFGDKEEEEESNPFQKPEEPFEESSALRASVGLQGQQQRRRSTWAVTAPRPSAVVRADSKKYSTDDPQTVNP